MASRDSGRTEWLRARDEEDFQDLCDTLSPLAADDVLRSLSGGTLRAIDVTQGEVSEFHGEGWRVHVLLPVDWLQELSWDNAPASRVE